MNVAIVGEKGGGGKTTFATNLAGIRASRARDGKVALIDTDRQGSSRFWNEERVSHGERSIPIGGAGDLWRRLQESNERPQTTLHGQRNRYTTGRQPGATHGSLYG